jgi:D-alanyl-D-alanine carboxypeptidase/D-alanyl-D-alanine-endopeptidase (penicillin-binding protein 4)
MCCIVLHLSVVWAPLALASDKLAGEIEPVIGAPRFTHAHWGLLVVDAKSEATIYEQNADKLFVPASTTKLFSVAAALDALGADYRFRTRVYRRGGVDVEGRLTGDLVLVASGDLTFGGRTTKSGEIAFTNHDHTYANGTTRGQLTEPDPLAGLDELARQVAAAGIRRVTGEIMVDDRLFDRAESTGSGPSKVTPIRVNDNLIDFVITPTEVGKPAQVDWRPRTIAVSVDAQIDTVSATQPIRVTIHSAPGDKVVSRGRIPIGHKPLVRVAEIADPSSFARSLFIEALKRAGVVAEASPITGNPTDRLPAAEVIPTMPKVGELVSPPFSEAARLILKVSHNLHASTLPLLVAVHHGKRTLADGLRLQRAFLMRAGVDVDDISFGGGAGGSRADYTTPRATVQLLRYMATRDDFAVFRRALPILGIDGTLADVLEGDSPARGKVQAKTGTLFWENTMNGRFLLTSKALAGYLTSAKNRELVFAIMVNHVHLDTADATSDIGRTLGRICEIIYLNE